MTRAQALRIGPRIGQMDWLKQPEAVDRRIGCRTVWFFAHSGDPAHAPHNFFDRPIRRARSDRPEVHLWNFRVGRRTVLFAPLPGPEDRAGVARGLFHHPDRESEHGEESQGALVRPAVKRSPRASDSKLPAPTLKNGETAATSRSEPGAFLGSCARSATTTGRTAVVRHRLVGRPPGVQIARWMHRLRARSRRSDVRLRT